MPNRRLSSVALVFSLSLTTIYCLLSTTCLPQANAQEEVTITTYYPSPYGSYKELTTTDNTYLATHGGSVGIGTTDPWGVFHVFGGTSAGQDGLDIKLEAQSAGGGDYNGGHIVLVPGRGSGTGQDGSLSVISDQESTFVDFGTERNYLYIQPVADNADGPGVPGYVRLGSYYWVSDSDEGPRDLLLNEPGGNVGIGATGPVGSRLTIQGSGNTNATSALNIINSDGMSALFVMDNGRVGIGTTSPSWYRLDVAGSIRAKSEYGDYMGIGGDACCPPDGDLDLWIEAPEVRNTVTFYNRQLNKSIDINMGHLNVASDGMGQISLRHTSAAAGKFWNIGPDNASNNFVVYNQNNTGMWMGDGHTSWTPNSDSRLKTNIQNLTATSGLAAIAQLKPVTFNWKDARQNALVGTQLGFIAQDVQPLFPGLVSNSGATTTIQLEDGKTEQVNDTLGLDYTKLIVPVVQAIKELKADNDALRKEVEALRARVK